MTQDTLPFQSTNRSCPLCGVDDYSVLVDENINGSAIDEFSFSSRKAPEFMHHRMVICSTCDLAYANPVPDFSWLRNSYIEAAFNTAIESELAALNHARLLDKILPHIPDRDSVLDIGSGDGAFLSELVKRGFAQIRGVEPSLAPIQQSSKEVREFIEQGFFNGGNYAIDSYSLVTCFQVLEHVEDITDVVRSVFRILKPGGVFLTSAHNYRAITARILKSRSPIFDIEHLQLFSLKSCRNYYHQNGYKHIRVEPMANIYPVSYWVKLMPAPQRIKSTVETLFRWTGVEKIKAPMRAGNLWAWGKKPV